VFLVTGVMGNLFFFGYLFWIAFEVFNGSF
jgi:hypothetical protein